MTYTKLLRKFMEEFGPSGYEKEVAHSFKAEMELYADNVSIDRMGNVIACFNGTDPDSPGVMAFAHLDQLGFIIRKIEPDGYIQVDRLGGIPEKVLPGLNVRILTRKGTYIDGVFGNKSHHASLPEDKYKVDFVTSLLIDIGARSEAEVEELGISIGCPVTYKPYSQDLQNGFVSGTAIDNRGGLTALVIAARQLKEKRPASTVYLVGTVWEEFNLRGAIFAARACKPDITISLDVVLTGDTHDLKNRYDITCGKGPAVLLYTFHGRGTLNGTIPHQGLVDLAHRAADEEGIPLQRFAGLGILTDTSYVQLEGQGMAAVELGFPTRYTHTPVEVVDIQDIIQLGDLLAAMLHRIDSSFDLNRY